MPATPSGYLFLLGFAAGLAVLALTAYRRITPLWLRAALIATALFMMGRYVTLAAFASVRDPQSVWILRHFWFASSVALTFPSVFAVDQLLRHPKMTPRKLLIGYSPFLAVYASLILFGQFRAVPDRITGWTLELESFWPLLVSIVQSVFVLLFVGASVLFLLKVPMRAVRVALALLAFSHLWMAFDGALLALGGWYFRPFLFSEMAMLASLWYAYETAYALQHSAFSLS